jgi:hypothetical protein
MVIQTTQVTVTNISIKQGETLKIGIFGDTEADLQLPEGFHLDAGEGSTHESILNLVNFGIGAPPHAGAFHISSSPEEEPLRFLIQNLTDGDQTGLILRISRK